MRSITEALADKYSGDDDEDISGSGFVLFVPRSPTRRRLPSTLILDHCDIDSVGDEQCLSSLCHEVKELDLAHNQISEWNEVNKLISCLPQLNFLNLSYNLLGQVTNKILPCNYPSLKKLVLNRVGIQWDTLVPYLKQAPNLEELHLSFNQMDLPCGEQEESIPVLPKISTLHFDGNRVEHLDHLEWISKHFPCLTSLVLCDCPLWTMRWKSSAARIMAKRQFSGSYSDSPSSSSAEASSLTNSRSFCSGDGRSSSCCGNLSDDGDDGRKESDSEIENALFPQLRSISLNNSYFDCWEEVDLLRRWPSLVELRLQSCPLFQKMTEHERRQMTIARLPNLKRLNGGCDITPKEREESERNFLRRFHDREVKPKRYEELVNVHGYVAPLAEVSLSPPKVANVWVRYGEQRWNEKTLSLYITMKELRDRLSVKCGLPANKIRIVHDYQCGNDFMRFPSKRLYSYNVKDGDEFTIMEKF